MSNIDNEKENKESPIENKYLQEQRLDDNFIKEESSTPTLTREAIDFDKISLRKTNTMVELSLLESSNEDLDKQPIEMVNPINDEVFGNNTSQDDTQNDSFIKVQPQPMQFMTNGGLTIHNIQETPKKKKSKKNKKTLIFCSGGFVFIVIICIALFVLKSMGIIDKPTIDEIYRDYDYNYTNNVTKFVYDGNVDLYFIENEVGFDIISINDENVQINVIEDDSVSSLDLLKSKFDNISNETSLLESSEVIQINHKNYEVSIDDENYNVLSKEIIFGNNNLLILMQYNTKTNEDDIELNTLNKIYSTIIFENY